MEAPAPSRQARRSAGRLTFTQRHHRARRARAHAPIRRSSSYAYDGGADRQHHRAPRRRQGLSRPQCAARLQVQGVHLRPEAAGDAHDQTRVAPTIRGRAGHRPSQVRASDGPQLPWHREGDAANAVLAAAGYNFRRLIKWLSLLLFEILARFGLELRLIPA